MRARASSLGIGPEEASQGQCHGPSLGDRRMTQNISKKMHLASLPADSLKMSLNRFFEPFVVIGDHQVHTTQSPAFEIPQHVVPRSPVFTGSQRESRISRCPSSEIPVAIRMAIGTTLSFFLTWITRESSRRKG